MRNPLLPALRLRGALLAVALSLVATVTLADDTDIYTNPTVLPLQAPLTAIALDLNVSNPNTVVCDNVLLSSDQNCVDIRAKVTVGELLTLLGAPITIVGGLNPQALLSDLGSGLRTVLATPLSVIASLSLNNQQIQILGIQQILEALTNSRVTVILNHANRGPGNGVCAFGDKASVVTSRQETLACSNGAYLFKGLTNLANPVELAALLTKITTGLSATSLLGAVNGATRFSDMPYQTKEIYAELAKYLRGDAIFNGHLGYFDYGDSNANNDLDTSLPLLSWDASAATESADHKTYVSGLAAFPQACSINLLHIQATAAAQQNDSDDELNTLFPNANANRDNTLTLAELVDSAATDGFRYGAADTRLINSSFVVQDNLFSQGDLSDLDRVASLGSNVSTYTGVLGLLGRGQGIAASLIKTLAVDTTLGSIVTGASRTAVNGTTDAAYLTLFRPEKNQKPAWYGNLKRLTLRATAQQDKGFVVVDASYGSANQPTASDSAIAADGRIRSGALTLWTDASKLGTGVTTDGRKTDLGGAGQRIPGFQFGGGGNPGRGSSTSARTLYYDSTAAGPFALARLNADDTAVRSELVAATGATAVTLPDPNCAANCQAARSSRDAACNATGAFTQTCANENTACLASCSGGDYSTACNNEQASCNATCTNPLTRTTCLAACATTRLSCPATKIAQCNLLCPTQLALCPATKQAMCLSDSASQFASCSLACTATRTADTLTRELLLYARGYDVGTRGSPKGTGPRDSPTNSGIVSRPWLLGAVLHSKPLAINYGRRSGGADDVRVVFGSADGVLHMVSDATGVENWGFMPQAVMGALATLRENESGAALPYGVDGSPVVLIRDRTGSDPNSAGDGIISSSSSSYDRVLLFFGLRRGGGAYYALDITNPDAPKLQWRLSSEGLRLGNGSSIAANSAAQFSDLALTFSTPQVARIRRDADGVISANNNDVATRSVLIFGGGYNGGRNSGGNRVGKDLNNSRAVSPISQVGQDDGSGSSNRGNALYMIDAETGELLWRSVRGASAGGYTLAGRTYSQPMLVDSIASDLTVLDTDNDGFADRLYVGDTGGRLWRADFASILPSAWTFGPIASIGRHNNSAAGVADDRRIFSAPDYVPLRNNANQGKDLVLFGTGDREDVLNLSTVNWLYGYLDSYLTSSKDSSKIVTAETDSALAKHAAFTDTTNTPLTNLSEVATGYKLRFARNGEKMFSTPVTLGSTVTFSTYIPPDPGSPDTPVCVPSEGGARLYKIGVQTTATKNKTTARDEALPKPGLPGEVSVLSGTAQSVGNEVYSITAKQSYRASWRERLGETQK